MRDVRELNPLNRRAHRRDQLITAMLKLPEIPVESDSDAFAAKFIVSTEGKTLQVIDRRFTSPLGFLLTAYYDHMRTTITVDRHLTHAYAEQSLMSESGIRNEDAAIHYDSDLYRNDLRVGRLLHVIHDVRQQQLLAAAAVEL